jgi:hypothetical protein
VGRKIDHVSADQKLFAAGGDQMRDHSRAMAGRLNGVHARQELGFSLEGPDVFPGRHRRLNALGEALARRSEIERLDSRACPPFQFRGGHHDLGIREDLRIALIVHEAVNVVAVEMGDEDRLDGLGVKACRRHALEQPAVPLTINRMTARARVDQDHLIAQLECHDDKRRGA